MKNQIQYLQHQEIDKVKWDQCIEESSNGLIYASSVYLDHMCENWDAIVINDYEAVVPIPWKKKYGIRYIYQPPFIQQLGFFYKDEKLKNYLQAILQLISDKFKFGDYPLNFLNEHKSFSTKKNFILPLHESYQTIAINYKDVLKRNLKHSNKNKFIIIASSKAEKAIDMSMNLYSSKIPKLAEGDYIKLKSLCTKLCLENKILIREAKDENGNLLAVNLCLKDSKRIYLLLSSTTTVGRKKEANHFLLDQMIKEFAEQPLIFDFEGSDIPGIAYFYEGFGGINQPYYYYQWNQLPMPVKMIKKIVDKIKR